jgi:site-specific DNA-methyltransferase (adenine-specific)
MSTTARKPSPRRTPPARDHEPLTLPAGERPEIEVRIGDCRDVLARWMSRIESRVDLVFADPPFNWGREYDRWRDDLPEDEYLGFTYDWLDLCVRVLRPGGALWVNIPDDWAAEITCYLKGRFERRPPATMSMVNWCLWHYRFGQNTRTRFINSKVHALYFVKSGGPRTWNADPVLELSDRASIYNDPRTESKKDGMPPRLRVPMDVWYGQYWGRIQGNNKERRGDHDNQLPEVYLERVVLACSNRGDLVLDPFLGSGTTGVVAHWLGRRFIGVEYSPENARRALERIRRGPVRPLGRSRGVSTAIFQARPARARSRGPSTLSTVAEGRGEGAAAARYPS